MDRVFESGASASPPAAPAIPSTGYPTAGNPAAAIAATKPGPYWYHMITESLRKLIVDSGLTPDHEDLTLISSAVQQLISSAFLVATAANGFRNKLINGGLSIDQRYVGAAQIFTAGAALAYCVDRWYGYCTGANVSGQRVAGSGPNRHRYQFTGAAGVTGIGFGQRIEKANSIDLAGSTATLSVDLANSLLTTVNWTAYYASTDDTFGSLASPTRTQIATGSFTVNSAVTRYSTPINIPSEATTGLEVVFSVGAQVSGTWVIGNVQLEAGSSATAFERRPVQTELSACQRYFCKSYGMDVAPGSAYTPFTAGEGALLTQGVVAGGNVGASVYHPVRMRANPTVVFYDHAGASGKVSWWLNGTTWTAGATPSASCANAQSVTASYSTGTGNNAGCSYQYTANAEL